MEGSAGTRGVALCAEGWDAWEADIVKLVVNVFGEAVVGDVGDFLEGPKFSHVGLGGELGELGRELCGEFCSKDCAAACAGSSLESWLHTAERDAARNAEIIGLRRNS